MAVAGSLTYDTKIDGKGFEKGLDKLKGATTTSMKAIGVATAAATTAVVGLVTASVKAYAEYEQLVGGVDTLFKDSSQKVQEYANIAYKTAGLSANQYMSTVTSFSASLLQSLGGDTEKAADYADQAIIDMSDNANKMGTSMESIQYAYQGFAKQNYTMLDNLKLGYGGTKEEMQRLLEDASKISGIEYDISSFADVTQAIHVMQESMGIAGTTAKEANTTIEGSINSVKGAWENLLVGITNPDADWDVLIQNLVDTVTVAGENLLPAIKSALVGVSALIRDLFPLIAQEIPLLIAELLPQLVESGVSIVNSLITGFQQNMPLIINAAIQIIMTLVTSLLSMLPQILEMGIQIILQLIIGISQQLPTLIPQIIDAIILIVETLLDNIDLLIDAGIQLIIGLAEGLIQALPKLIDKIPQIIDKVINAIVNNLPKIIEMGIILIVKLAVGLVKAIPKLVSKIPQIISSLIKGIASYYGKLGEIGKNLLIKIKDGIVSGISKIGEIGRNIVEGLWNGIKNAWDWIKQKVKEFASGILDGMKDALGIHSPSTLFRDEIGRFIPQGVAVGIEADTDEALKAIDNMNDDIMSEMNKAVAYETGSINAQASVKSNNSMLNVIQANFAIDGSVNMDSRKVGRIIAPTVSKTLRTAGV